MNEPQPTTETPTTTEKAREIAEKIFLDFCGQTFFSVADSGNWLKDRITAALTRSEEEKNQAFKQRDQMRHLLIGGTLTAEDVKESGLGEGVLIEQRHAVSTLTARLKEAERLLNDVAVGGCEVAADLSHPKNCLRCAAIAFLAASTPVEKE